MPIALSATMMNYNLPQLGDSSQSVLTTAQEHELGKEFFKMVKRYLPIEHDPIINDYIQNLGYQLVAYSPRPSINFKFFVVRSPEINAFAGPDGYIGVNSGLILKTTSESELASVMAHEIAHVAQRHITRGLVEQKHLQLSSIVAVLAAIAIGTQNPNAGVGAMTAATAGGYQQMLNFSRGFENEADRVGMQIMANAGFDPRSMPSFFGRLAKESILNGDDDVPELLRTHPVTENRLADAENRSEQYPKFKPKNNFTFHLMQARIIAELAADPAVCARRCKTKLEIANNYQSPTRYTYAMALTREGQYKLAMQQINLLIKEYPEQILFKMTKAKIEAESNHAKQAINDLAQLYHYNSDYYPLVIQYTSLLMNNNQYKKALKILVDQQDNYSNHPDFLNLLAKAQAFSGQKIDAYKTRAQMYQNMDEKTLAIQQLKIALQFAQHSPYDKQLIKAKIKELNNAKDD